MSIINIIILLIIILLIYYFYINYVNLELKNLLNLRKNKTSSQKTSITETIGSESGTETTGTESGIETTESGVNENETTESGVNEIETSEPVKEIVAVDITNIKSLDAYSGINTNDLLNKIDEENKKQLIMSLALLPVNFVFENIVAVTSVVLVGSLVKGTIIGIKTATGKLSTEAAKKASAGLATKLATSTSAKAAGYLLTGVGLLGTAIDLADIFGNNSVTNYQQGIKIGDTEKDTTNFKQAYIALKKDFDNAFEEQLKKNNMQSPYIIGPLTTLKEEEYVKKIGEQTEQAMVIYFNKKENVNKFTNYITTLDKTFTKEQYQEKILEFLLSEIMTIINQLVCEKENGKNIILNGNNYCSYKSKEDMLKSFSWPIQDGQIYGEWKKEGGGYSIMGNPTMKSICDANGLKYDDEKGICEVTKNFCLDRGLDWSFNPNINEDDCKLDDTQNVFEMLLGSSTIRFLKQVFDPKQYETCKEGEIDDGLFCRKVSCPEGDEMQNGLCYKKCDSNYNGNGPICWQKCPDNFRDDGGYCAKPESYTRGAGRIPNATCPEGQEWYASGCYSADYDKNVWERTAVCTIKKKGSEAWWNFGAGELWTDCGKFGYRSFPRTDCEANEDKDGALCYPKCRAGFHAVGCCVCSPDCPQGMSDIGVSCMKQNYPRGAGSVPILNIRAKQRITKLGGK